MPSLLDQLPNMTTVEGSVTGAVAGFANLTGLVGSFSSPDVQAAIGSVQVLQIPDALVLVEPALASFDRLAQDLPATAVTGGAEAVLMQLIGHMNAIGELTAPLTLLVDQYQTLLTQPQIILSLLTQANDVVGSLDGALANVQTQGITGVFELLKSVLNTHPDLMQVAPYSEILAQVNQYCDWMAATPQTISQQFQDQIQSLADALPVHLDHVMQNGVQYVQVIQHFSDQLARSIWHDPYQAALAAVQGFDLADAARYGEYLAQLDTFLAQLDPIAHTFDQNVRGALAAFEYLNAEHWTHEVSGELRTILTAIRPPMSPLAKATQVIASALNSVDLASIEQYIALVDESVGTFLASAQFDALQTQIEALTQGISDTANTIETELMDVSMALSSTAASLGDSLSLIDLDSLLAQIETAFDSLLAAVDPVTDAATLAKDAVEGFVTDLAQEVADLNLAGLQIDLTDLLTQVKNLLDTSINDVLGTAIEAARSAIDQIKDSLENVSLVPIFDEAVAKMDELAQTLSEVDVSELNSVLRQALSVALELLKQIDFTSEIKDKLLTAFELVLDQTLRLAEPLQQQLDQVADQLQQYDLGAMLSEVVVPVYETASQALSDTSPSDLLQPLIAVRDDVLELMDALNPQALVQPLISQRDTLLAQIQALSPAALVAPLNDRLDEVKGLLSSVQPGALFGQLSAILDQFEDWLGQLAFATIDDPATLGGIWSSLAQSPDQLQTFVADIQAQVDGFLDAIVDAIPEVDVAVIAPALAAMASAIQTIEDHVSAPLPLQNLSALRAVVLDQHLEAGVTALTQQWMQTKALVENAVVPDAVSAEHSELIAKLQAISPIELLAPAAAGAARLEAAIERAETALGRGQAAMQRMLAERQADLQALVPDTGGGFRPVVRELVDMQIGRPLNRIFAALQNRLEAIQALFVPVQSLATRLQQPFTQIQTLRAGLDQIQTSLTGIDTQINAVNFDFLVNELQDGVDDVIAQLSAVEPETLVAALEIRFDDTRAAVEGLYPETAVQTLDSTYQQQVLDVFGLLNPQPIIDAVTGEFTSITSLLDQLQISQLFDALTQRVEEIGQELDDGLTRSEEAFKNMIDALPL